MPFTPKRANTLTGKAKLLSGCKIEVDSHSPATKGGFPMRFLTRRVLLIAIIISFVPCFLVALPIVLLAQKDDPFTLLLVTLVISVVMFVMGLGVQYIDFLCNNRNR